MNWLVLTVISTFLISAVNFIDKYLVEKYLQGRAIGSLVMFSSLIGLPVALIIFVFNNNVFFVSPREVLILIMNGMFYVSYLIPYFYALNFDDASVVSPLVLLSSIFSLILGYLLLGETLTTIQLLGSFVLLTGALGLSLDIKPGEKIRLKKEIFLLMLLSSFLIALNTVIFKFIALETSFWATSFWEYIGLFVSAFLLFCLVPSYRTQFLKIIRSKRVNILGLNMLNETIAIASKISFNLATMLVPLALVSVVASGFQPLFLLVMGIILTLLFPRIIKENIEKRFLLQKILAVSLLIVGVYLLDM